VRRGVDGGAPKVGDASDYLASAIGDHLRHGVECDATGCHGISAGDVLLFTVGRVVVACGLQYADCCREWRRCLTEALFDTSRFVIPYYLDDRKRWIAIARVGECLCALEHFVYRCRPKPQSYTSSFPKKNGTRMNSPVHSNSENALDDLCACSDGASAFRRLARWVDHHVPMSWLAVRHHHRSRDQRPSDRGIQHLRGAGGRRQHSKSSLTRFT